MHGLWAEVCNLPFWALLIETLAGLLIGGYCLCAVALLAVRRDRRRAQRLVAEGALAALSLMLCATLLKTLLLSSWQQIGMFATVLALRTGLKRVLAAEAKGTNALPEAAPTSFPSAPLPGSACTCCKGQA